MKIITEVAHHSVRPNSCMINSFKAAVLVVLPHFDGLALATQRLLNPHVAYLGRPNSHGQLIAQHLLKPQKNTIAKENAESQTSSESTSNPTAVCRKLVSFLQHFKNTTFNS
jgi:hypothetical protein